MLPLNCGRRSLAWLTPRQRKVRTPEGSVPRENGGTLGQKPQVTESVSENKPPGTIPPQFGIDETRTFETKPNWGGMAPGKGEKAG